MDFSSFSSFFFPVGLVDSQTSSNLASHLLIWEPKWKQALCLEFYESLMELHDLIKTLCLFRKLCVQMNIQLFVPNYWRQMSLRSYEQNLIQRPYSRDPTSADGLFFCAAPPPQILGDNKVKADGGQQRPNFGRPNALEVEPWPNFQPMSY